MTKQNNSKLNIQHSILKLAPIVLFVYNRPDHTRQTVEALQKNEIASESELFIYSDAAKNENAVAKVNEVREYISSIDGFKNITIIKREKNWGLANSIIDGVTKIVNEYGKIIVLEDDLVTSPYFLKFMNEALEVYEDEKRVWHVSGWNYPIETDGLDDVFMWRLMNCWGWATWADRWQYYEKDVDKTINEFSKEDIKRFNLDGFISYWSQVISNKKNLINSWAVFWYVSVFKHNGLCLNPTKALLRNIGSDGTGVHCGKDNEVSYMSINEKSINPKTQIKENIEVVNRVKKYHYMPLRKKIFNKVKRIVNVYIKK